MEPVEKKMITLKLNTTLLEQVKKKAEKEDVSVAFVIRKLLSQWVLETQNTFNF